MEPNPIKAADLMTEVLTYLDGPRNGPYEHELACHRLRALPIDERLEIVDRLIEKDVQFGLRIGHNALGKKSLQSNVLMPALMTCDAADIKHYVFYCVDRTISSDVIRQIFRLRREQPRRVGQILYYLTACLNECATQAYQLLRTMLNELEAAGALDFDTDTWEGGPNDVEWFARVDAARPIIWWPICDYLRFHGTMPREDTVDILDGLRDLPREIRPVRKRGKVAVIAEARRPRKGQSMRALLDEVGQAHGLRALGDKWRKITRAEADNIATAFIQYDLARHQPTMAEPEARQLANGFMWRFTMHSRWYTNLITAGPLSGRSTSLTDHTFDCAIACVDAGVVAILVVADEE